MGKKMKKHKGYKVKYDSQGYGNPGSNEDSANPSADPADEEESEVVVDKTEDEGTDEVEETEEERQSEQVEFDEEDQKETIEVNIEKMKALGQDSASLEKKIRLIEQSLKELSSSISDITDERDEIKRGIRESLGDSQLAIKNSDHSLKEVKRLKREIEQFISEINERIEGFWKEMKSGLESLQKIESLDNSIKDLTKKILSFEEVPEKVEQQKIWMTESYDKLNRDLGSFKDLMDELIGRTDTALERGQALETKLQELDFFGEKLKLMEEILKTEIRQNIEEIRLNLISNFQDLQSLQEFKNSVSDFQKVFSDKIESTENRYEEIKSFLARNLDSLEEKFRSFREDFTEKITNVSEKVSEGLVEQIAVLEEKLSKVRLEIEPDILAMKELTSDKFGEIDKRLEQQAENFAEVELKIEMIKETVSADLVEKIQKIEDKFKELDLVKTETQEAVTSLLAEKILEIENRFENTEKKIISSSDELAAKIDSTRENVDLEMEVLIETIKKEIYSVEEENKKGQKALLEEVDRRQQGVLERMECIEKTNEEYRDVIGNINRKVEETSARVAGVVDEKLKTIGDRLEEVKIHLEKELSEKLEPILTDLKDIGGDLSLKLEPIRKEVDVAKRYIEEEMMKVKESWEKLDKTISDSQGAMEIAQKAKQSLERLEKEAADAISRIDSLVSSIRENSIKTDSNLEKINLTIKLIDEARERVKAVQTPPAAPVVVSAPSIDFMEEDLILSRKEILESPDTADMSFDLDDLLQVMIKHEASDLHLKSGSPPTVRLEGELIPVGNQILTDDDCKKLILSAMSVQNRKQLARKHEVDFAYAIPSARFRVNAFFQKQSISAAFRLLWTDIPTVEELNLPPVLKKLCDYNHGLILVTGPAGCGKSTTLAAMINYINETKKMHIITIEDPIEFLHTDKMSIITQREVGTDTQSFSMALKQSLRQDPNVILIGEMRDPETIMTAAIAAETGHLVLSTLHTPNTIQAINRIIDVFSGDVQKQFRLLLSNILRGIVSQRLLTRADESGRIPAVEVMVITPTIASLILEGNTNDIYQHMAQGDIEGMQTFTRSLIHLFERGLVTREEAMYHADQPTEFRLAVEGHTAGTSTIQEDSLMSWL